MALFRSEISREVRFEISGEVRSEISGEVKVGIIEICFATASSVVLA